MRYGWSIDPKTWQSLPEELAAPDMWRSVSFSSADANSVPTEAGIYALCSPPPNRMRSAQSSPSDLFGILYTALYIGRTNNLRVRFQQHISQPSERVRSTRAVFGSRMQFWFSRHAPTKLRNLEAHLIDCFGPSANKIRGTITAKIQRPLSIDSGWSKTE